MQNAAFLLYAAYMPFSSRFLKYNQKNIILCFVKMYFAQEYDKCQTLPFMICSPL